jgi:hypothetical protein
MVVNVNQISHRQIDSKLYYTIENIIGELTQIIINFKNVPIPLIDFYEELQYLSDEIESRKREVDIDIDDAIENLNELYQVVLDLLFEELEKQANETNIKKSENNRFISEW